MADRHEHDSERRFDRERNFENERWAPQGREYGHQRQDRGNERGSEREGNFGGHSGSSGYGSQSEYGDIGRFGGSQGGYSGSQAGYSEPRGGFGRANYGRENFGNAERGNWQGGESSRTTTYAGEREQSREYPGGNWGQSAWGGGMGTYAGAPSGERGNFNPGTSNYGQTGQSGRYTGRGPKSYQRSDDRVKEDINERLTQHAEIDATEIDVEVKQGEVTLRGTVDNRQEKRIAEDIADNVSGVKDVKNEIRVQSRQTATSTGGSPTPTGSQVKAGGKS